MNTIVLDGYDDYELIGEGAEGEVFKLDDDTVYKYFKMRQSRKKKIEKIKYLKNLNLNKFVQIKDIVSDGCVEIGYTMKLIKTNSFVNVKNAINDEISLTEKINYLKNVEATMKEAHKNDIVLVDMFYHNFLINDKNDVIGIDLDNFQIKGNENDLKPTLFYNYYKNKINKEITKDLDIVSNTLFLLYYLTYPSFDVHRVNYYLKEDKIIEDYIKKLKISNQLKELFLEIVSDSKNKPYLDNNIDELKGYEQYIYSNK